MANMKLTHTPVIIACLLLPLAAAAQEAEDSIRIHGTVSTPDGMPVPYAKIMFISQGDTLSQLTSEDYHGEYEFYVSKDMITAVGERDGSTPRSFKLHQNYPNPFNPTTTIEYSIEKTTHVELTVFNMLGQVIRSLERGMKQPGSYRAVWNGRTDNGLSASAGLYFYSLSADGYVMTRKMLLIDGGTGPALSGSLEQRMSKPGRNTQIQYEIIVMKSGYDTYRETGFTVSANNTDVTKDITITPQFEPGDYFPLADGNTWEFLTLDSPRWRITDDHINGEYSTGVIDTRTIDGKEYYVLDRWTHFLPTILWNDDVTPLVRIDEAGTLILRYGNVDIPLYPFAEQNYYYDYVLYEYFTTHDPASDGKQEKYEAFKDVDLEIYAGEDYRTEVWTPSGTYDDCKKIHISCGPGINESILYFNQDAGPVHCEIGDNSSGTTEKYGNTLKRAHIGGKRYGVPVNVLNSDTITDADIAELLRMIFDRSFVKQFVSYSYVSSYSVTMTDIILTGEFPYWHLLPDVQNINFIPMENAELIQLVENKGRIIYYGIADESNFSVDGEKITLDFGAHAIQPECLNSGYCGGSGVTVYEFSPYYGVWTVTKTVDWYWD